MPEGNSTTCEPLRVQEFQIRGDTVGERWFATSEHDGNQVQLQQVQLGLDRLPGQVRSSHGHVVLGGRLRVTGADIAPGGHRAVSAKINLASP